MTELIDTLSNEYDYVLLDTPALLSVVDTEILIRDANGLILVVRRNHTKRESVQMASKFLVEFKDKMIGLVMNQSDSNKEYGYYQHPRTAIRRLAREQRSLQHGKNKQIGRPEEQPIGQMLKPDDNLLLKRAEEETLQAALVEPKKQPAKKISKTSQSTEDVAVSKPAEEMPQQLVQVKLKKKPTKKSPKPSLQNDDGAILTHPEKEPLQAAQVKLKKQPAKKTRRPSQYTDDGTISKSAGEDILQAGQVELDR